ncbi:MAG: hypothetical protein ACRC33_20120, partial [Gemmataceae bacterium]
MARRPIDRPPTVNDILRQTEPLPEESSSPIRHYRRTASDLLNAVNYIERAVTETTGITPAGTQHLARIHGMSLVAFVETFERFLKEVAAECVNALVRFVADDRFDVFKPPASGVASHFGTETIGQALCESATWLDTGTINSRFRALLAEPFAECRFVLNPPGKEGSAERERFETLAILWQLRHTAVHNVGVITRSDAVKLSVLARQRVEAPRLLTPTKPHLVKAKNYLDWMAEESNRRIGEELARVLTTIHTSSPGQLEPAAAASRLTTTFDFAILVGGVGAAE